MADENQLLAKVKKAVKKDYAYLCYNLPYKKDGDKYDKGYLEIDRKEKIETKPYSFSEISDIVKKAFEELYKVKNVEPIGLRGETFYSDKKELEIFASGGESRIEYRVRKREKEEE